MYSRKQYLYNEVSFHDYYLQFATPELRSFVCGKFSPEELKTSTDPHFNDIELARWDDAARLAYSRIPHETIVRCGDFYSLSFGVCLLKTIARDLVNPRLAIQ